MADQEEDFSSLPLPERFAHKNWKVRKEAYEAATNEFNNAQSDADPVVRQFVQDASLWKAAAADSNVAAHQEALTALCAFLDIAGTQGCIRTRPLTITPLAEKGMVSTKPVAKQKALDAILLYVELDKPEPVIEELLPSLSHKTPKVVAATLSALTAIYREFGCKTVDPKPVLKLLPKMYGHADKNVRAEAQNLTVELYRWLREGMKALFWSELKPVQQQDLENLFEPIKDQPPPKPERLLRSQQAKAAAAAATTTDSAAPEEDHDGEQEDEGFDLEPDAVDVIPKIPKDLQERLASTKWKDRKDALDELQVAINCPRIQEGPFDDIVRSLAKCMKDANIAVVTVAANCIEILANGLRKCFSKYRSIIMGPMLERLKERKQSVTDALGAALDALFASSGLSDCLEETVASLQHKNPQVKLESTRFLTRSLKSTKQAPDVSEVKQISDAVAKLLTDPQEIQRNAAAEVLGVLLKIMGDRIMNPHLQGLDDIRQARIKEYCESAEVKAKYKPKAAAPPPKAATGPPTKKQPVKRPPPTTTATPKKPTAPVMEDQAPTPLQSKPAARAGIPKPGAPRGLKPPSAIGVPGKKLAQTTTSQSTSASPKRPVQSPPLEEEPTTSAPKPAARGLTGRPLGRVFEPGSVQPAPSVTPAPLPSADRIELDELRAEVERLRSTNEGLRAEHLKLTSQVHELQDQNAQLIEDHTRDVLSIKAKETQLVRARSDAETAEATSAQLQREVDRLKRELSRIGRANNGGPGMDSYFSRSRTMSPINAGDATAQAQGQEQPLSPGSPSLEQQREGKENIPYVDNVKLNMNPLSPSRSAGAGLATRPYSSNSSASTSQTRSQSRPNGNRDIGPHPSQAAAPPPSSSRAINTTGGGDLSGRSLGSSGSSDGGIARTATNASIQAQPQGQESWRRAAEVTQSLKAKIEQMRQRQGLPGR